MAFLEASFQQTFVVWRRGHESCFSMPLLQPPDHSQQAQDFSQKPDFLPKQYAGHGGRGSQLFLLLHSIDLKLCFLFFLKKQTKTKPSLTHFHTELLDHFF